MPPARMSGGQVLSGKTLSLTRGKGRGRGVSTIPLKSSSPHPTPSLQGGGKGLLALSGFRFSVSCTLYDPKTEKRKPPKQGGRGHVVGKHRARSSATTKSRC